MAWKTKIKSVALRPGPRPPWWRSDSKPQSPELAGIGPRSSLSQALRVLSLAGFIITVILSMAPISTDYRGSEVGCGSLFDQNMRMLCDPAITRRLWALLIIFAISLVVLYGSRMVRMGNRLRLAIDPPAPPSPGVGAPPPVRDDPPPRQEKQG